MKKLLFLTIAMSYFICMQGQSWALLPYVNIENSLDFKILDSSNFWMKTQNDIFRFSPSGVYNERNANFGNFSHSKIDSNGDFWSVDNSTKSIQVYRNNTTEIFPITDTSIFIYEFYGFELELDLQNRKYLKGGFGEVYRLDSTTITPIKIEIGDSLYSTFSKIRPNHEGGMVYRTNNSIIIEEDGVFKRFEIPKEWIWLGVGSKNKLFMQTNLNSNKIIVLENGSIIKEITLVQNETIANSSLPINNRDEFIATFSGGKYLNYYSQNGLKGFNIIPYGTSKAGGYVDRKGDFYIKTQSGLIKLNQDGLSLKKSTDYGLSGEPKSYIKLDSNLFFVSCRDRPINLCNDKKCIEMDSNANNMITYNLIKGSDGRIYGLADNKVMVYNGLKWNPYSLNDKPLFAEAIYKAKNKDMIFVSWDTTYRVNELGMQKIKNPTTFTKWFDDELSINEDNQGHIWVSQYGKGVFKYDGIAWTTYNVETTSMPAIIYSKHIVFDSLNLLYMATHLGLLTFNGSTWNFYDSTSGVIPSDQLITVVMDQNNVFWFNDYCSPSFRFKDWDCKKIELPFFNNACIMDLIIDDYTNDKIFFSNTGLVRYNEKDKPTPPITPIQTISDIITFYPNPASENLTIRDLSKNDRIQFFDLTGRKLLELVVSEDGKIVIDIKLFTKGLYLLQIQRLNQTVFQGKVIKD